MIEHNNKIIFNCPECGKKLSVNNDKAGFSALCPNCGKRITIPSAPGKK